MTLPKREETKARRIEISGTEAKGKTIDTQAQDTTNSKAKEAAGGA